MVGSGFASGSPACPLLPLPHPVPSCVPMGFHTRSVALGLQRVVFLFLTQLALYREGIIFTGVRWLFEESFGYGFFTWENY